MSNHGINPKRRREFVALIRQRDGDCCVHCGGALGEDATLEHVVPRSRGGENTLSNLALAHGKCNEQSARGGGMDAEQRRELAALVARA